MKFSLQNWVSTRPAMIKSSFKQKKSSFKKKKCYENFLTRDPIPVVKAKGNSLWIWMKAVWLQGLDKGIVFSG